MDDRAFASWKRTVDAIVRGDARQLRSVRLGPTPEILRRQGLPPVDLVMSAAKIATARREHPQVGLEVWHQLPELLVDPLAIFPSIRRDGTIVVILIVVDADGMPVVVPIVPGTGGGANAVLSVYGKTAGLPWVTAELARARSDGLNYYTKKGFAASMPKPGSAEAIPSSPGPIPADGTTKPNRKILSLREKSIES